MPKKTIILSPEQINEICGPNSTYLDNLYSKPFSKKDFANQITTDGDKDFTHRPTTTDDYSHEMVSNWKGISRLMGMGPIELREFSKKEFEEEFMIDEENSNIQNMRFGASDGNNGHSAGATAMTRSRMKRAEDKLKNGNIAEKIKAQRTINKMKENEPKVDQQIKQFENAVENDRNIRQNKVERGERVHKFATKTKTGTAHSQKGIITYQN